ncbi:ABC transporter ATP-binding protein [Vibrio parahaemolyticus]|uniref:ABC transporter ATP-binding protein n=1 Tax=Vibrio parahaemolyticus TaxID=670 RepID=UPI001121EE26|nr:sn-glycerol-3-phosphate ABC transporter ATP-binding protein UgpC [Vibrio parahaemolyticus]TOG33107.1 sugar ABC transporter ATP-binding protein [Vibrio parahaemolyticus]HCM1552933.1 sn-glycerol-3-phosphate ABC transporter ATP-binding protein UgpC [Vibrio parahaemolyticus]
MASVQLYSVTKSYENGFNAVSGIDLDIKDGEFMVFVGPSGCAKSTTLRMIAGLEDITGGEIKIGERIVNMVPAKDRGVAMVFQDYALYPHKTVYDNMAFGLKIAKMPKDEIDRRVHEAAKELEITDLLSRKPKEMSGGQRQRVAVGRAIVRQPEVFLFDEPLSNLDAKLRVSMRAKISKLHQKLKKQGSPATMIYVTHDQIEALTLGDRICVLNKGEIMQVDTPSNLYRFPKNKFVAGFIGTPPMNLIDCVLDQIDGRYFIEAVPGENIFIPEKNNLMPYKGTKVCFGIRPEHVKVVSQNESNSIDGKLLVVENMGDEKYLHFRVGAGTVISKMSDIDIEPRDVGNTYKLKFDTQFSHIFDVNTEQNITLE